MKMRKIVAVAMLALVGTTEARVFAAQANACANCRTIAGWYYDNTNMSGDEIAGFLIECYNIWDCWG